VTDVCSSADYSNLIIEISGHETTRNNNVLVALKPSGKV